MKYSVMSWLCAGLAILTQPVFPVAAIAETNRDPVAATIVQTQYGAVRGTVTDRIPTFKGIPFAKPPIGALRWAAPQDPAPFSGIFDATQFGPSCLQSLAYLQRLGGERVSEDCLTLNIWTQKASTEKRPVMVWIHGGAFRGGTSIIPGEVLAKKGVVVVSVNYRLGPLGFFAHEKLKQDVANFGLLDMVKALEWVRDNIAVFGGDPQNVTIFGVSAGGMAVDLLMVSEQAKGLFHRAIAQSGYATWPLPRSRRAASPALKNWAGDGVPNAEDLGEQLVKSIGQTHGDLRKIEGTALVDATPPGSYFPIVDGVSLTEEPAVLFLRGQQHDVPFLTGGNSFDGSARPGLMSSSEYAAALGAAFEDAKKVYGVTSEDDLEDALTLMFGDHRYVLSARVLADAMKTVHGNAYLYYLDFYTDEFARLFGASERRSGAPHAADTVLLFGGHLFPSPEAQALAKRMQTYWVNFARTGVPSGEGTPAWPAYNKADGATWLILGQTDEPKSSVIKSKLDFWERLYQKRLKDLKPN